MEYVIGFGYILPMVLLIIFCLTLVDEEDKAYYKGSIFMSILPVINLAYLLALCSDDRKTIKNIGSKLSALFSGGLSEEARQDITKSKNELKTAIEKLKQDHKDQVEAIKKKDEKKVLLDKLGLTEDDLEKLKNLK